MRALTMAVALAAALAAMPARAQVPNRAPCREVGDLPFLRIAPVAGAALADIGLDRAEVFARMRATSIPETMGCWAMPVGNFDGQLVSVGMAQWNYGTGSLQPLLAAWRARLGGRFRRTLRARAPMYGKLLFSRACRKVPVDEKCRAGILAAHGPDGRLDPVAVAELTAIFEDDAMLQVQTDAYVALLLEVRAELLRVFPEGPITPRKVRWAIDTRVQQKALPPSGDVARLRRRLAALPVAERPARLRAILAWYRGLAESADQDGASRDYAWNVEKWGCLIDTGRIDPEQFELLHLTFLRSRTATGESGRWQALTFSRRAKIILDVGSVSGVRDGDCARVQMPSATTALPAS